MYIVSFHTIFSENALILAQRLGVQFVQNLAPEKNDIIIVFGAQEQADKLVLLQQAQNVSYIIIQTEQVQSKVFDNKYYVQLLQTNMVLDWSKYNVEFLKKRLSSYRVYSFYFYEFLSPVEASLPAFEDRPIDYFFAGVSTPTRQHMLQDFQRHNPTAVMEFDFSYNHVNQQTFMEKLKQVKYVINIPYYSESALEIHRINRALSAGCEVVSLPSADEDLNQRYSPYVHFVPRLNDFSTLLELERRSDYMKVMKDFGAHMVESNLRGIVFAEKCILEERQRLKNVAMPSMSSPSRSSTTVAPKESIPQPVTTDFTKFLHNRMQPPSHEAAAGKEDEKALKEEKEEGTNASTA
jgi:hypothetical protein